MNQHQVLSADDSTSVRLVRLPQHIYGVCVCVCVLFLSLFLSLSCVLTDEFLLCGEEFAVQQSVKNEPCILGTLASVDGEEIFNVSEAVSTLYPDRATLYVLKKQPLGQQQQLKAFVEDTEGRMAMVGTVGSKEDMRPKERAQYGQDRRSRMAKADQKKEDVVVKPANVAIETKAAEQRRAESMAKRARNADMFAAPVTRYNMTADEMRTELMRLFEEVSDTWTKQQLLMRTNQADKVLTEALKQYCIYHSSGALRGQWELKPEYKIHKRTKSQQHADDDQAGDGGNE